MILLAKNTYKNVTCEIVADQKSERYICGEIPKYNPDECDAYREAKSFYESPKNKNKRKKITITERYYAISKKAINNHKKAQNKWLNRELKKYGSAHQSRGESLFGALNNNPKF